MRLIEVDAWMETSARRWLVRVASGYAWASLVATVAARLSVPRVASET